MLTRAVLIYAQLGEELGDWGPCQRMRAVRTVLLGCDGLGVGGGDGVAHHMGTLSGTVFVYDVVVVGAGLQVSFSAGDFSTLNPNLASLIPHPFTLNPQPCPGVAWRVGPWRVGPRGRRLGRVCSFSRVGFLETLNPEHQILNPTPETLASRSFTDLP
jgi:hypothetical protein